VKTEHELMRQRAGVITEYRAILEGADARDGKRTDEERARTVTLKGEIERLDGEIEERRALDMADPPTLAQAQRSLATRHPAQRTADTETAILCRYIRTGDLGAAAEMRAYNAVDMVEGTPAAGGYAVPVGMYNQIVAKRDEMSLVPKLGLRKIPGKGLTVNVPVDNEPDIVFTAVTEASAIGKDSPALNQQAMTLVKYAKYISLTWELLRDEDANLIAFINDWLARGWAATINSLILTEAAANGTAGVTLASTPTAAQIMTLIGSLPPEYQEGAAFVMHPTTYSTISGLTGNPFQFIQTPQGAFTGPSISGYPVHRSSYAPAPAASAKTVFFGNWNFMGYREATELTLINDPYGLVLNGQVRIVAWFDFVAKVLQAEGIYYGTQST
jgi:HK97 family phage major capsid protein